MVSTTTPVLTIRDGKMIAGSRLKCQKYRKLSDMTTFPPNFFSNWVS